MRFTQILTTCAMLAISTTGSLPAGAQAPPAAAPAVPGLTLTSPAFEDGSVIPAKFTQSVTDFVSPKLAWTNVPPNTVSFVLIAHDPDLAIDKKIGDVLHWMAFNIPGTSTGLPEAVPANATMSDGTVQAKNRRGAVGYLGPGAPAGPPPGPPQPGPANATMSDGTVQAKNRRGAVGYLGPGAPAVGPYHHYTFELFALDTKLSLGADATRADVLAAIDGHILGKGVLVGRFHK